MFFQFYEFVDELTSCEDIGNGEPLFANFAFEDSGFFWMAQLRPQKGCLKSKGVSQTLRILMDMEFVVKSLFFVGFPSFFGHENDIDVVLWHTWRLWQSGCFKPLPSWICKDPVNWNTISYLSTMN